MRIASRLAVFSLFSAAALTAISAGSLNGQDKGSSAKLRGQLPQNWSKLGLSDTQKTKIYEIQGKYYSKIDELQKQIAEQRDKMRKEEEAILTSAQKDRLREILLGKAPSNREEKKDKN